LIRRSVYYGVELLKVAGSLLLMCLFVESYRLQVEILNFEFLILNF